MSEGQWEEVYVTHNLTRTPAFSLRVHDHQAFIEPDRRYYLKPGPTPWAIEIRRPNGPPEQSGGFTSLDLAKMYCENFIRRASDARRDETKERFADVRRDEAEW